MPRLAVALVWLYQGLWVQAARPLPRHGTIIEAAEADQAAGSIAHVGLETIESGLAVWVLLQLRLASAAVVRDWSLSSKAVSATRAAITD